MHSLKILTNSWL